MMTFGHIPGTEVGEIFASRSEVKAAGLHKYNQAGISFHQGVAADAIVISGGYEDDLDLGDEIVYTGYGGNDPNTRKQIADQRLEKGNEALSLNCLTGTPVRVIRGGQARSQYAPQWGYRYDGLYRVTRFWHEIGRSGFLIWRFHLSRLADSLVQPSSAIAPVDPRMIARREMTIQRIIRNSIVAQEVKVLYDYRCQICEERIVTAGGPYAEGAHIRPLGMPHRGPDVRSNILCLCPSDHVRLDYGAIVIANDLRVHDLIAGAPIGRLNTRSSHNIDRDQLQYHRSLFLREPMASGL